MREWEKLYNKTQVGFEDSLHSGHIITRPGRTARWIPPWAFDDRKVRHIVYNQLHAYVRGFGGKKLDNPSLLELEKLATKARTHLAEQGHLAKHIATIGDRGTAATYTAMIYMAYRRRMHSNEIAEHFGATPPQVRQTLHRLNVIARRLFPESENQPRHWTAQKPKTRIARQNPDFEEICFWYQQGISWRDLKRVFHVGKKALGRISALYGRRCDVQHKGTG